MRAFAVKLGLKPHKFPSFSTPEKIWVKGFSACNPEMLVPYDIWQMIAYSRLASLFACAGQSFNCDHLFFVKICGMLQRADVPRLCNFIAPSSRQVSLMGCANVQRRWYLRQKTGIES